MGTARFVEPEPERQDDPAHAAPTREHKIKAAMAFLREALAAGSRPAAEVEAEGLAAGHAHATLALARKRAYIRSERKGNAWMWSTAAQRRARAKANVAGEHTS